MTESYTTPDPAHRADAAYGSTSITGTTGVSTSGSGGSDSGTAGVAKEQAGQVAEGAKQAGQQVASEAKHQAGEVKAEVGAQARNLLNETRGEMKTQANDQQQRIAGGLRALGQELSQMASGGEPQNGPASDLVNQASQRVDAVAQWLESREPGHVLEEVQTFARQRPGAFLAIAAGAGLLVGRLARGAKDAASDDSPGAGQTVSMPDTAYSASTTGYSTPTTPLGGPTAADPVEPGYPYAAPGTAPATPGYYAPSGPSGVTTTGREGFSA